MMMCDVMPTISEDGGGDRDSQGSTEDSNFEQLMVNMLDERDKLMDQLRDVQDQLHDNTQKLKDTEREREALEKQLNSSAPQVGNLCLNYLLRSGAGLQPFSISCPNSDLI